MAVVKNLMIRIGADYSAVRQGMQGATRELNRFKTDTNKATTAIKSKNGLGGIGAQFRSLGSTVSSSLSQIRGAKGIGGVASSIKTLLPALGGATKGFGNLGGAAGGTAASLGSAAAAIGVFVAVLAVATAGIYQASQTAVRFQADLGRLNMQLKSGSAGYLQWARSMGLAKQTATQLGATYGTLLSSFISDTDELQQQTKQLVHATRVVASATGRTIDDTFERMRSGLLGNTEAIEDLGVFVNVSMIESTKAFKRFAGDKSWAQIDFQTQQQIRLAAILEQSYARYGSSLQNNVMTQQEQLMEQLKDIKLHLSQAFLPLWESILPGLIDFAKGLSVVSERLARLMYQLSGKDYDKETNGLSDQTDAAEGLKDGLGDAEKAAKKTHKALAAFDQLNLIGESGSGGDKGKGGGTGGGIKLPDPIPTTPGEGKDVDGGLWALLQKKYRLNFDLPNPPDAGAGAVATAVLNTINGLIADVKSKMSEMWDQLSGDVKIGVSLQLAEFGALASGLGTLMPLITSGVILAWSGMLGEMMTSAKINLNALRELMVTTFEGIKQRITDVLNQLKETWHGTLDYLQVQLNAYQPYLVYGFGLIAIAIKGLINPLDTVKAVWHSTLDAMQVDLNAYRPYLEYGWSLLGTAVTGLSNPLAQIKVAWSNTLQSLKTTATNFLEPIVAAIQKVLNALNNLKNALMPSAPVGSALSIGAAAAGVSAPKTAPVTSPATGRAAWVDNAPVLGQVYAGLDWLRDQTSWTANLAPYAVPGPGAVGGIGKGVGAAASQAGSAIKSLLEMLKGLGVAVPALANGGIAYGPTLAMVGDNRGAATNPEVIAPLSDLEGIMSGGNDNRELIAVAQQILSAVSRSQGDIVLTVDGAELGRLSGEAILRAGRKSGISIMEV